MAVKTLGPEDLFDLRFLNGGRLSPDGTQVLYVVMHTEDDEDLNAIWWHSLETGETRQMTSDGHSPAWSPDGHSFAFVSDRDEKSQIFVMPIDGGEAHQLTEMSQGLSSGPVWSPNGETIAFTAGPAVEEPFDFSQPYRVTRSVYRFDGIGYLDQAVQDIYLIATSGGDATQLTDDDTMNTNPCWSPDGREILYQVTMHPHAPVWGAELWVVDLEGNVRDLLDDWGYSEIANWTPDGRVVFIGQPEGRLHGSASDVYVLDRVGGVPENRTSGLTFDPAGVVLPDMPNVGLFLEGRVFCDEESAWVRVQVGGTLQIYRVGLDGDERHDPIVDGDRVCLPLDVAGERLLFAAGTTNDPMQLMVSDLNGGSAHTITDLNAEFLADNARPEGESLRFQGVDGVEVEGWYLRPVTGDAPYPTILYIHGGPHLAWGHAYSCDFQMLAAAGYGVLLVNHRASTGYGDEFATAIHGDWGNLDYEDLMAGVDHVVEQGLADAERLGVCGLSGGGNLSCWIVGHTDRFKAAIPENPVTNFVSFYGTSDIGAEFAVRELGGHPHEIPEVYARCSPITYAHNCTTPTLLVQAENDYRAPAEQSEQFYTVLKANGCTVEMVRLPESPHPGSIAGSVAVRRAQNEAMLDWFQRYIPVS